MDLFKNDVLVGLFVYGQGVLGGTAASFLWAILCLVPPIYQWFKSTNKKSKLKHPKWLKIYWSFLVVIIVGFWGFAWGFSYSDHIKRAQESNRPKNPISIWFDGSIPEVILAGGDKDPITEVPTPRIWVTYRLKIHNSDSEGRFVSIEKNFDQEIFDRIFPKEHFSFETSHISFDRTPKIMAKDFDGEIKGKKTVDVYIQWLLRTKDQNTKEFYTSLKAIHPDFSYYIKAKTERGETASATKVFKLGDVLLKRHKEVFGEKPQWD